MAATEEQVKDRWERTRKFYEDIQGKVTAQDAKLQQHEAAHAEQLVGLRQLYDEAMTGFNEAARRTTALEEKVKELEKNKKTSTKGGWSTPSPWSQASTPMGVLWASHHGGMMSRPSQSTSSQG